MADQVRSGIIGAGFIGGVHATAVRAAGGVVTEVADQSPDAASQAARRLGAIRGAESAQALIASNDVDLVHICTPNDTHAEIARMALRAGKAVICEKPLAMTLADADELAALARLTGSITAVPFVYRYYQSVREARNRVLQHDTGDLWLIHGSYLQDWLAASSDLNWRVDADKGGASRAFADIGVHWCDLVEFTTGHRILRLSARTKTAWESRDGASAVTTEDIATIQFETDLGALGSLVVSQVSPGRKNRLWLSIDGSEQSLQFDQELPDSLWVGTRPVNMTIRRGVDPMPNAARLLPPLPPGHPQGYQDCFNAFIGDVHAAIQHGRPHGLPDFEDGARAARITSAVLNSAKNQAWVEV